MRYLIVTTLLLVSSAVAYASGDCKGHSCDDVDVDVATGDTNVDLGGDSVRSLALGNVLGDVDIAECLGSTQWNTPVFGKQKLVLNQVCMAEFYLKMEKFRLAAMSLCNVPEILGEFKTEEECERAHDFTPAPVPLSHEEKDEILHDEMQMAQLQIDIEVESLEERLNRLEAGRRAAQRAAAEEAAYKADLIQRIQRKDNDDSED